MQSTTLHLISSFVREGRKLVALLIDPDTFDMQVTPDMAADSGVDLVLVGGSLLSGGDMEKTILAIKKACRMPVIIFPGSIQQINGKADAILNLSLISGRNPEFLIGQHVVAAPALKASGLEILPTGYILVDSGRQTTASYISGTTPVPRDKDDIAMCTAMAGEMLGLKIIYLDGGSGAMESVSESMIRKVRKHISVPLIVGGGIRDAATAVKICRAGADVIVIGNAAQENPRLAKKIASEVHSIHTLQ
jgi:putative glycerol-1-phosphate prenyltransferase